MRPQEQPLAPSNLISSALSQEQPTQDLLTKGTLSSQSPRKDGRERAAGTPVSWVQTHPYCVTPTEDTTPISPKGSPPNKLGGLATVSLQPSCVDTNKVHRDPARVLRVSPDPRLGLSSHPSPHGAIGGGSAPSPLHIIQSSGDPVTQMKASGLKQANTWVTHGPQIKWFLNNNHF